MQNFLQWFESLWNGLFGSKTISEDTNIPPEPEVPVQSTTATNSIPIALQGQSVYTEIHDGGTNIQYKARLATEVTTDPINVVYDPTPVTESVQPTKLELWIKAAIQMEGANPANNNPGNIIWIEGTWMQKLATGHNGRFCIFKDYETGYAVLQKIFTNAATGKSQIYSPIDTLYVFYSKYAPDSDGNNSKHYAEFVASIIASAYPEVTANTVISTLI